MAPLAVRLARTVEGPEGGVPVVLLHGSPLNRWIWSPQGEALAGAGYRVVLPDLRGHGESPLGEGPSTVEAMAGDVLALADELSIERFVVGGMSFGGWVAMQVVRERPQRVLGMVLAATRAEPDSERERAARPGQAEETRRSGIRPEASRARVLTPETVTSRPEVWAEGRAMIESVSPEGRARAIEGMALRPDFRPALAKVQVPTLVIVGSEDPITPPEQSREIARRVPGAFLQVVEGASHFVTLEAPGVVSQAILNWLAYNGWDR